MSVTIVLHLSWSILVEATELIAGNLGIPGISGNVWVWEWILARQRQWVGATVLKAKATAWAKAGELESIR